ncbi:hypothetical protein TNCV_3346181 [Trichonephila clavipes]|nr:hypothetical protein TNCV_3346181 [Trichonephila clavipes]
MVLSKTPWFRHIIQGLQILSDSILSTDHPRCMNFEGDKRSFPTCTKCNISPFPPRYILQCLEFSFPCLNCKGGDRWWRHLSSLREFHRVKSYCHLYGAKGQRQAYIRPITTMNFVGLDLTMSDTWHEQQQNIRKSVIYTNNKSTLFCQHLYEIPSTFAAIESVSATTMTDDRDLNENYKSIRMM